MDMALGQVVLMTTRPAIILVEPQLGENIGSAARVMLNFGLTELRIVAPRDGWPNPAANTLSAGAFEAGVEVSVSGTWALCWPLQPVRARWRSPSPMRRAV